MVDGELPESERIDPKLHAAYNEIAGSAEFAELRRRFLSFVVPATAIFMIWYVVYVLCNNWARDFMATKVIGNINIALVFGLLQFASTFVIAFLYSRHASRSVDPAADALHDRFVQLTSGDDDKEPGVRA